MGSGKVLHAPVYQRLGGHLFPRAAIPVLELTLKLARALEPYLGCLVPFSELCQPATMQTVPDFSLSANMAFLRMKSQGHLDTSEVALQQSWKLLSLPAPLQPHAISLPSWLCS